MSVKSNFNKYSKSVYLPTERSLVYVNKMLKTNEIKNQKNEKNKKQNCPASNNISDEDISKLEIPTGNPLVLKFDETIKLVEAKYLDQERAKNLIKFV